MPAVRQIDATLNGSFGQAVVSTIYSGINQYRVIRDLMREVNRDNVVITHDAGSPREQLFPFWETTRPHSYLGWGKSHQLGTGLGLIIGLLLLALVIILVLKLMGKEIIIRTAD